MTPIPGGKGAEVVELAVWYGWDREEVEWAERESLEDGWGVSGWVMLIDSGLGEE
jgi:hypothetical protein